jgi:lipopolysaccharide assembly outer membrane protein LptD (OstA)
MAEVFWPKGIFTLAAQSCWHFRTSDLRVTLEGYGLTKHTRFHLGSVPVLYTPYLVFPAKTKRQTGLLPPRLGRGDRLGWDVDLPFFWAISRSTDATVYSHYMSKRGLMVGPEFRYAASKKSKGVFRFDYLRDQEDRDELREQNFYTCPMVFKGTWISILSVTRITCRRSVQGLVVGIILIGFSAKLSTGGS